MKLIQLIISLLITLCAFVMSYGALTTYSILRELNVGITLLILAGCLLLVKMSYKELRIKE